MEIIFGAVLFGGREHLKVIPTNAKFIWSFKFYFYWSSTQRCALLSDWNAHNKDVQVKSSDSIDINAFRGTSASSPLWEGDYEAYTTNSRQTAAKHYKRKLFFNGELNSNEEESKEIESTHAPQCGKRLPLLSRQATKTVQENRRGTSHDNLKQATQHSYHYFTLAY